MIKKGSLILLVSLLAACTHVPEDAGFADVRTLVDSRSGAEAGWRRDEASTARIEATVKELTLGEIDVGRAVRIALLKNPSLQATYEGLGIAAADLAQAGLLSNPMFASSMRFPDKGGKVEIELSLVQNFIDILTLPARNRLAKHEFEVVKLEVAEATMKLAAQTRAGFFDLVAARQRVAALQDYARAADGAYELALALRKAGNITELALAHREIELRQAEIARDEAEVNARQAALRLGITMGVGETQAVGFNYASRLPTPKQQIFDLAALDRLAATNRLDLEAARARIDAMAANLKIKVDWRLLSDLEVGIEGHRDSTGEWASGPSLGISLPLFDQGGAQVLRGKAHLRRAAHDYEALALQIRGDIRSALDRLILAQVKIRAYEAKLLPLQARILELTLQNYNYMLTGAFDLLATRQTQANIGGQYIDALHDYWLARTKLEAAVGGDLILTQGMEK